MVDSSPPVAGTLTSELARVLSRIGRGLRYHTRAAREALEKLCAAYWYPLYAYVRRKGRGPEDAADAVQGFFVRLVERDYFAAASRERGRLRSFLIHQMDCWLADETRHRTALKRGGAGTLLRMDDAEARYAAEPETRIHLYGKRDAKPGRKMGHINRVKAL